MGKIVAIFADQAIKSQYEWKVVIGDNGQWGYTTSKKLNVGDDVEFEMRNTEFRYYVKLPKKGNK